MKRYKSLCLQCLQLIAFCFICHGVAERVHAVGWGSNDLIISGGTNLGGQVGVFDADLNFKGYLERPSSFGVDDFNAAGQLVGREGSHQVRVFDSSGNVVGGFFRADSALMGARKLNVAPNGNYLVPESGVFGFDGVQEFQPDGIIVRQYGSGVVNSLVVIPENKAWAWFPNDGRDVVRVLDLATGLQTGTVTLAGIAPNHFRFSPTTNTVLVGSIQADAAFEVDLSGQILHRSWHHWILISMISRAAPTETCSRRMTASGFSAGRVTVSSSGRTPQLIRWAVMGS